MSHKTLPKSIKNLIYKLTEKYKKDKPEFEHRSEIVYNLLAKAPTLKNLIHSVKYRSKDVSHFKDKLIRKYYDSLKNHRSFDINIENVYDKITDLAAVRILHINTNQIIQINETLNKIFEKETYSIIEGPIAHTWDVDYQDFYKRLGIKTILRESMYTSVHYVVSLTNTTSEKGELQVRTLMDEVWGEVSHIITYPTETKCKSCKAQLKILARITSSGIRLVDNIFDNFDEYNKKRKKKP